MCSTSLGPDPTAVIVESQSFSSQGITFKDSVGFASISFGYSVLAISVYVRHFLDACTDPSPDAWT